MTLVRDKDSLKVCVQEGNQEGIIKGLRYEGKFDLLHQCIFVAADYEPITSERL